MSNAQKVERLALDLTYSAARVGLAGARTVLFAPLIVVAWAINKVIDRPLVTPSTNQEEPP
jgi:hypothetical protein